MSVLRLSFVLSLSMLASCRPDQGIGEGTYVLFSPESVGAGRGVFFDFPYPSDFRRNAEGKVDFLQFPISRAPTMAPFPEATSGQEGFSVLPVGYFRFNQPLAPIEAGTEFAAQADSPLLLLELGPSPRLLPVSAATPRIDAFVPANLLAVGVAPGVVLAPSTRHAFVVRRSLPAADTGTLGSHPLLAALLRGETPAGEAGKALKALHAPLLTALSALNIPFNEVAAATVFTTGDAVAQMEALSVGLSEKYSVAIEGLGLKSTGSAAGAPFCQLNGTMKMPQFQRGTPPFDADGLFEIGADGWPVKQREDLVPVSFTLPRAPMPPGGFPLIVYFHGSGGVASEFLDGGDVDSTDISLWPASVLTPKGFALAGASLPISPERVEGVGAFDYLNLRNPVALRDTFRQGMIESRLFTDALESLRISPTVLAGCAGPSLPTGEDAYRFSLERLSVQGQSMGGMYANMVSALEPRIQALVPTGAGGFWSHFAMVTPRIPDPRLILGDLLGTGPDLSPLHPAMHLIQSAWEVADPIVYVPRLGHRPLPNHPARSIYEPIGDADSYFSRATFDAMVAAYGHPLAGNVVWDSTLRRLEQLGRATTVSYPVSRNLQSENGQGFTGVAAQYALPPGQDGHGIYRRTAAVRHQYACFHSTFRKKGIATVVAPEGACPE